MQINDADRRSLFERLTGPHPSITDRFERRRARTLGRLTFGLFAISIAGVILALFINDGDPSAGGWTTLALTGIGYGLSRLRRHEIGSVFIIVAWIVIIGSYLVFADPLENFARTSVLLVSLAALPLLALLVAGTAVVIASALFTAVATPIFVTITPGVTLSDAFGPFIFHVVMSALFIVLAFLQRDDIRAIAEEVGARTRDIEAYSQTLEAQIDARAKALETVAVVNTQIATILDIERLLQDVVDLTKERFQLYHAHLYLFDDNQQTLELASGAGHVGRQMVADGHAISPDHPTSIVARSARERSSVRVNDVNSSETFLPNPLLPETQSELSAPLVARGQTLGVLDVQSSTQNFFDQNIVSAIELLAGQVAAAISNARLFEAVERTSRHERAVSAITRHIQTAFDLDDILQITVRELGKALRVPYTAIELKISENGEPAVSEELA